MQQSWTQEIYVECRTHESKVRMTSVHLRHYSETSFTNLLRLASSRLTKVELNNSDVIVKWQQMLCFK